MILLRLPPLIKVSITDSHQGFIAQILAEDSSARVIASGDFNEFSFVKPIENFTAKSGLTDLDEVVGRPIEERYT